jgi:hypothetical protein
LGGKPNEDRDDKENVVAKEKYVGLTVYSVCGVYSIQATF